MRNCVWACVVTAVLAVGARAEDHKHDGAGDKGPGLAKLKKLVGTWVAAGKDGKRSVISISSLICDCAARASAQRHCRLASHTCRNSSGTRL